MTPHLLSQYKFNVSLCGPVCMTLLSTPILIIAWLTLLDLSAWEGAWNMQNKCHFITTPCTPQHNPTPLITTNLMTKAPAIWASLTKHAIAYFEVLGKRCEKNRNNNLMTVNYCLHNHSKPKLSLKVKFNKSPSPNNNNKNGTDWVWCALGIIKGKTLTEKDRVFVSLWGCGYTVLWYEWVGVYV